MDHKPPLTQLLSHAAAGDQDAQDQLWAEIYDELHRTAALLMRGEAVGHTLQPTAVVHEAYVRLLGSTPAHWENRRHFFGAAARSMRQLLVDYARRRNSLKRGGDRTAESLEAVPLAFDLDPTEILSVDDLLDELRKKYPRQADVVELRFFAGLTVDETAEVLDVSPRTVDHDWQLARAWLFGKLSGPK